VKIRVAIDDAVQVCLNGVDITASGVPNRLEGGFQRHGGCAEGNDFVFPVPEGILTPGSNLLAIRTRDQGAISNVDLVSFVDLQVTGERR